MGWNPFDIGQATDPKRNAWLHSEPFKREQQRKSAQQHEVFRATALPGICLIAVFAAFWGNRDLQAFWTAQREWAALLQAVALVSVVVIFARLCMIATRRYGQDVAEEGMPPVPAWFRLVLASMELGQMAGLVGIVLVRILDLDGQWSDAVLVCLLGAIALTIGQALLRWRAETYGWVTGRLFWGRFD